ncbi:MAG: lamin tail domain-containing protein [Acholeplasmataceae bacterium]|nr:lamin tail domain-containing protein [Acholeplasmataceae bacterium]
MKHLTKTLFTVIAFTFLTLFLVSCDESLDQLAINEAIDAIELVFAEGDDINSVTQDLTLPEEFGRVTITWQSGNTSVITDDGVVTRQRMDTSVTLIAVATYNALTATKSFVVTVLAADETPVIDILEDARASLLIPGVGNGVTQDIALPMTVGQEGVTVTWESSHPEIVADDGSLVFQPDENTSITMTATLHLEGQSLTKVFNLVVIAAADVTHVQSIEEARDISTDEDGVVTRTYVLIPDVTILGITNDGVVFYDETGILFAYMGARRDDLVVGGVYNVRGLTDRYFGSWQVNNTADPARPVVFQASDAPATAIDPIVVASVTDMLANHETVSDTNPNLYYTYYRLTAKVRIQGTGNYDTVFVDPDYEGDNIPTDPNSPHATEGVMIYYQSNKAAFDAFDGVVITFDALFYSYRSDRTVFTILFLGTVNDIGLSLPDEEVLDLVQGSLESSFEDAYTLDTTLDLPTSLLGASIDWETDSPLVDLETGALTMPENAQETVTLTATATINGVERVITISFIAGELDIITLADARAADGKVRIQGVVTAQVDNRSFMIQDATGALAIYTSNAELIAALTAALGKEVDMVADRGDYNGLEQLSPISIEVLGDAPLPAARSITNVPFTAEDLLPFQAMLVSAEGLEVVSTATDQYNNIILMLKNANEEEIELRFDSRIDADTSFIETLVAGDFVNIVGAPLSWAYNAPRLYFTDFSQVTEAAYIPETDEEKVLLAADALDIPSEIGANVTLPLPTDGLYGTSIAWDSDNAQIDATTGEVTVTGTAVVVTLTATVTLNAAEEVREFEVTVGYITQTVADARAAEVGTQLTIEATITAVSFDTSDRAVVFVQDDYEGIYLYKVPAEFKAHLAVGNTIKVTGSRAVYQNLVQLNNFVDVELVSEGNVTTPLLVTDPTMLPDYQGQLVSVTGYLKQTYTGTPSDYHLVTTEGQFALRLISGSDAPAAQRDTVYAALVGVPAGSEVTVVAGVGQYSTTMQIMLFEGSQITVGAVGADEDLLAVALANLVLPQDGSTAELDLTLPTEGLFGITVVWSSDNEAVISTTGVINRPAPGESDASVVLGYTVFMGETELMTGTITVTVPAGAFPVSTLAEARAAASGTQVRIQGVLTAKLDHRTFTVQDDTGALAIYTSNADTIAALTAAVGQNIDLIATRGAYKGLEQLAPVTLEVLGAGMMPEGMSLDDVAFTPETLLPFQAMLVSATGLEVVSNTTDTYGNIIVIVKNEATEELEIRWDSRYEGVDTSSIDALVAGDMINLVSAPLGWYDGARVYYSNPAQVEPYVPVEEPMTLAEARLEASGTEVNVQGVLTAKLDHRTFTIQDETGALAIYTSDSAMIDLLVAALGSEINLVATRGAYKGLEQLSPISFEVLGAADMPEGASLDAVAFTNEALLPFQAILVSATGLEVVSNTTDGYGNIILIVKNAAAEELEIRWDSRYEGVDTSSIDALVAGDLINIVSAPLGWYDGARIYYSDPSYIEPFDPGVETMTLAEARLEASGTEVTVQGIVTAKLDHRTFTIQDETGALAIYTSDSDLIAALSTAVGYEITLVATRGAYKGLEQLSPISFEVIDLTELPEAASLDAVAFTNESLLPFQTMLVSATGLEVVSNTTDGYGNIILIVMNADGEELEIRWDSRNAGVDTSSLDALVPGDVINLVSAPLGWYDGARVYYTAPEQVAIQGTPVSPIGDARLLASGTEVRVRGVLTAKLDHRTFTIQDETGALAIYTSNTDMIAALVAALGSEIDLTATRGAYKGLEQLSPVSFDVVGAADMPAAVSLDDVAFTNETLLPFQAMLVSATALEVVSNTTDTYGNIVVIVKNAADEQLEIRWDSRYEGVDTSSIDALIAGDLINLVSAPLGWYDGARVYYSDPAQVTAYEEQEPPTGTLFFSEYIEGGSYNKALEIYNGSSETVDLSTYSVVLYSNGNSTATSTYLLTGTLAPGDVIVLVHAQATEAFKVGTYYEAAVVNWNGDDAIVLYNGETVVDSFGQVGVDPGTTWSSAVPTADRTLVRNPSVTSGDTDPFDVFDPALEWTAYPKDTADYLGSHTVD